MMTNSCFYDAFALAHPDIAERCKISMFFSFKPYWVRSPDARTCMCIHHMNFYFMHDAYRAMMKKLHDPSGNGSCACDFGEDPGSCVSARAVAAAANYSIHAIQ